MIISKKDNLKKIIFSVLFIIITCELLLRFVFFQTNIADSSLRWDSSSWRIRWIKRNLISKVDTVLRFEAYNPLQGWIPKKSISLFDEKTSINITINSEGMRSLNKVDRNTKKIFMLGDSFTFGDEVSDDKTFSHLLSKKIKSHEVMNLGVRGYGHDQILIHFKEALKVHKPEIVILNFVYDDLFRNELSFRDYEKPFYQIKNNKLILKNTPISSANSLKEQEVFKMKLIDVISIMYEHYRMKVSGSFYKDPLHVSERILNKLILEIKEVGARPVFVYLPISHEANNTNLERTQWENFMFTICKKQLIDCISTRKGFANAVLNQGHIFPIHGHWKNKGHEIVSQEIFQFLKKKSILH